MDPQEEQDMEIEALQAIYLPHEFGRAESHPWNAPSAGIEAEGKQTCGDAWTIVLRPEEEDEDGESWSEVPVRVGLTFAHTKEYPHEPPLWRVHAMRGIGGDELEGMRKKLEEEVNNNLGMAMLFAMASVGKEWLREHLLKQKGASTEGMGEYSGDWMQSRKEREEEEEKKKMEARAHGIMVTPETFARWLEQFKAEQALERAKHMDIKTQAEKKKKATGRSYFEGGGRAEGDGLDYDDEEGDALDEDELQQLDDDLDEEDLLELEQLANEQIRVQQTLG